MIWIVAYVSSVVGAFLTILVMTMIRNEQRHSVGRIGWLGLTLLSPPIGLILFLWLGGRKVSSEHQRRDTVDMPASPDSTDEPDDVFEQLLIRRNLHRPTTGNHVELLSHPPDVHDAFIRLIESAKEAIYVMTFILDEKVTSDRIVDLLCRKARDGVQVRVLCDGFGSFFLSEDRLETLREAGGRAETFKPISKLSRLAYLNFRNHRKLAVADGDRAILGGANIVEEEMTKQDGKETWVDLSLWIEGPAAAQLQSVFCSDWNFITDESLPPAKLEKQDATDEDQPSRLTVMPIGPDGPHEILNDFWQFAIHHAKERIWICTPYFVPPPMAMRSLELACRRGVDVQLLVPEHSDLAPVDYARLDYFRDLIDVGATVLRYPHSMVHAKIGIVDNEVAIVGSANFDVRSFFLNYELTVVVHDDETIGRLDGWYADLAAKCDRGLTGDSWIRRALATGVRMFASEL